MTTLKPPHDQPDPADAAAAAGTGTPADTAETDEPGGPHGLDRVDGPDDSPFGGPHHGPDRGPDGSRADPARQRLLARVRVVAIVLWVVAYAANLAWRGLTVDRPDLILWTVSAVVAFSIGRRPLLSVVVDWLPFAALLMAYDFSRGAAHLLGRPTMWTPQIDVDRWLGGGNIPTVWLQEHLKSAHVPWWEFLVSSTYVSYFLLPYVVAGVLWLRNRHTWRRFVVRYVLLSFIGISGFVLFPAAPPWAAARCTAVQVADHPSNPACLYGVRPPNNALLGGYLHLSHPSASPYVEQLALRGFLRHGLPIAARAISEGHADANQVAAIPSLHAATSLFIVVFLWPLVRRRWRPLLVAYPLVMAFSLVYSAEHYVFDILLGWLVTIVLTIVVGRWERRRGIGVAPPGPGPDPGPGPGPPADPVLASARG